MADKNTKFTRITGQLIANIQALAEWGVETDNLSRDQLEMEVVKRTPTLRKQAAQKLIAAGMSQRQAAKVLGVNHKTIQRDVAQDAPKSGAKSATKTGSAETKERRAEVAAEASSQGVTEVPTESYRIIYADPPWDYGAHKQPDYQTEQQDHYATMPLEDICAIPVKGLAEDDAVLFLWTTSPFLQKSFKVVEAWGFEYKSAFIWDKIKHNMGHYNSVRHELLLICTRGSCTLDVKKLFDSVQSIESRAHSQKPVEFYDIIETIYTHGKKLEMFSRCERLGWDAYGHRQQIKEVA